MRGMIRCGLWGPNHGHTLLEVRRRAGVPQTAPRVTYSLVRGSLTKSRTSMYAILAAVSLRR